MKTTGLWGAIYTWKWPLVGAFAAGLAVVLGLWFGFKRLELALAGAPVVILSLVFPHVSLVVVMATVSGLIYGALMG